MKLTATSPCFNEIRFVRAWLQNCADWGADEVIVGDGGSTDGTLEVLRQWEKDRPGWLRIVDQEQPLNPQRYGFNEGPRREQLNQLVTEGLQVCLDIDEMLDDDFRQIVENGFPPGHLGSIQLIQFWRSLRYMRVGVPGDEHWGPIHKHFIYPAGALRWDQTPGHSRANCDLPRAPLRGNKFHFHYLFEGGKTFENRIAELQGVLTVVATAEIKLRRIKCELPSAVKCLAESVNYGEFR